MNPVYTLKHKYIPYIIVGILSLLQYSNTLFHEYALDDEMVIHHNLYVHKGIKGIGNILSRDSYQGFLDKQNATSPLSGGRYRPLSIITFAIEQDFFSSTLSTEYRKAAKELEDLKYRSAAPEAVYAASQKVTELNNRMLEETLSIATIRHVTQLIFFAISMLVFFHFLRTHIFDDVLPAFLCTLLFIAHPLHSEVVANIKSRDEILSFLFIFLTLHLAFSWHKNPSAKLFLYSCGSFVLALLSKEYAVAIPVLLIAGLYLLKNISLKKSFSMLTVSFIFMEGIFLLIRNSIIHQKKISTITDVLNDPYLYATVTESFCSRIALILEYFRLLFFPLDLSYDYSYPQIPFSHASDAGFWISLLLYVSLFAITGYLTYRRQKTAWYLIFTLIFLFMINNLLVKIGATLGERLLYHSSAGVCILLISGVLFLCERYVHTRKELIACIAVVALCIPLSVRTFVRNSDWKNEYALFLHDVKVVPNSALANGNAGSITYNRAFKELSVVKNPSLKDTVIFREQIGLSVVYLRKAIALHPNYVNAYMNLGLACFNYNQLDSAAFYWEKAASLFNGPNATLQIHARMFLDKGLKEGSVKNYTQAIQYLRTASTLDSSDPGIWENLGGAFFMNGNFNEAAQAFGNSLALNPNQPKTLGGKTAAENFSALLKKATDNPTNESIRKEAIEVFRQNGFPKIADTLGRK